MFCPKCGKEIDDKAVICVHCKSQIKEISVKTDDASSKGFFVLGFFIPLAGFILYAIYFKEYPLRSKSSLKGAIAGVILRAVLVVILTVIINGLSFTALILSLSSLNS